MSLSFYIYNTVRQKKNFCLHWVYNNFFRVIWAITNSLAFLISRLFSSICARTISFKITNSFLNHLPRLRRFPKTFIKPLFRLYGVFPIGKQRLISTRNSLFSILMEKSKLVRFYRL